jgi:LuxR family maltose regulon positive regulatory protein
MTIPIISTKLHIPPLPQNMVSRASLTDRLDAGYQGKFVLVSAPAGFGKTALLAEWAHRCSQVCQVCWVHLDESDNEPLRFVSYLIAALQTHHKNLGEAALSGLHAMPPAPIEAVLTSLVNEIDSSAGDLILILDDYHLIETPAIHSATEFLIKHLPPQMCLVIATRTDPPLPIHRLRARGHMIEIRVEDLRFSRAETRRYLEDTLADHFSTSDIANLDSRLEGWIAGLQMVALSIQGRQDRREFIETFSGSHRFIMDYLTEEIFNQQPFELQNFLLQTSILDRLSGPLCDALVGPGFTVQVAGEDLTPAQRVLEYLEHANLFLLPMDDERRWYRYHQLFANLLRQRLRQTWPEEIDDLQRRASAWYAANGLTEEAFKHALSANDLPAAAQLVESQALDYLKTGALSTLLGWLEQLPEETIMGHPWLSVFFGWALLLTGRLENLAGYLAAAEQGEVDRQESDDLRGHIAAIQAYSAMLQGEMEQGFVLAQQALDLLPEDDLTVRSVVSFTLGGFNYMRGDMPAAIEAMQSAGRSGEQAGNIHLAVSALSAAGGFLLESGNLSAAQQNYDQALKLATGHSGRPLPIAANAYNGLAQLNIARNDLENARRFAKTSLELAEGWGNVDSLAGSYMSLAHTERLEGNLPEAQLALDEAKHIAANHSLSPDFEGRLAAVDALIHSGDVQLGGHGALIEPLSEREIEVLRLMAQGRSNAEIAEELIIALGTVKAHSSSIYRKLEARGRTEAVIKARELELL